MAKILRGRRHTIFLLVLFVLISFAYLVYSGAALAAARPDDVVDEALQAAETSDRFQLEMPVPDTAPEKTEKRVEMQQPRGGPSVIGEILQMIMQGIFWIGVIGFVGYLIFIVYREWAGRRGKHVEAAPETPVASPPAVSISHKTARSLLEKADALAKQGRFGEAVHLLLFGSIEDIQERRGQHLAPALTAREILNAIMARNPEFGLIVDIVELSHFGGRLVEAADFERARDGYAQLVARSAVS
jgi:hypothetical protein